MVILRALRNVVFNIYYWPKVMVPGNHDCNSVMNQQLIAVLIRFSGNLKMIILRSIALLIIMTTSALKGQGKYEMIRSASIWKIEVSLSGNKDESKRHSMRKRWREKNKKKLVGTAFDDASFSSLSSFSFLLSVTVPLSILFLSSMISFFVIVFWCCGTNRLAIQRQSTTRNRIWEIY